jgi:hypothetical protein
MATPAEGAREHPQAGSGGPRAPVIDRARVLGPWPWTFAGWLVVLAVLLLALASCAGAATAAVDREVAATVDQADQARAELAQAEPGSPEWDEALRELAALRARLAQLEAERATALAGDTRDALTSTLLELGELLLAGGLVGLGVNRHRTKTRAAELSALEDRLSALEGAGLAGTVEGAP